MPATFDQPPSHLPGTARLPLAAGALILAIGSLSPVPSQAQALNQTPAQTQAQPQAPAGMGLPADSGRTDAQRVDSNSTDSAELNFGNTSRTRPNGDPIPVLLDRGQPGCRDCALVDKIETPPRRWTPPSIPTHSGYTPGAGPSSATHGGTHQPGVADPDASRPLVRTPYGGAPGSGFGQAGPRRESPLGWQNRREVDVTLRFPDGSRHKVRAFAADLRLGDRIMIDNLPDVLEQRQQDKRRADALASHCERQRQPNLAAKGVIANAPPQTAADPACANVIRRQP